MVSALSKPRPTAWVSGFLRKPQREGASGFGSAETPRAPFRELLPLGSEWNVNVLGQNGINAMNHEHFVINQQNSKSFYQQKIKNMAVQLTQEEQLWCDKMQVIYDRRVKDRYIYENIYTNWLIQEGLAPTYEQVRLERQKRQENEFRKRISEIEEGEIIDMVIELADYRRFRCVYTSDFEPKERVIELESA